MPVSATTVICLLAAAAVIALLVKRNHDFYVWREELDRLRDEKNIVIEFLHKTAEDISGANKPKLYERIVRATAISCGAMSACVYEKQPDGKLRAKAVEGLFPPQSRKIAKQSGDQLRTKFLENALVDEVLEPQEGIVGFVASEGESVLVKNGDKDNRVMRHGDDSLKIKSFIAVPIMFSGKLYGVLAAANPISGKAFSETDFSLARSLGEQAGLALHNLESVSALILKNKMESDLKLASSVQQYLLPQIPADTNKLQFAVKYVPQQLIGGDFYDFIDLPDGKLGIVIGDVSGKGASAAILMAICQTKLRYIARENAAPSKTLKKLNAEMVDSMRTDMFITMIYAVVDRNAAHITLARAGHEPALLHRSDSAVAEKIKSGGMALGMVQPEIFDETIEDISFDFGKGDVFTLYTDGVTEAATPDGEEFSTARLAATTSALAQNDAAKINTDTIAELEHFTKNSVYPDDLTLLTVKHI